MKNFNRIFIALCLLTMTSGFIVANEESTSEEQIKQEKKENPEDLIIIPTEEEIAIQNEREAALPQEIIENIDLLAALSLNEEDADYLARIHPNAFYHPLAIIGTDRIQLHDGSIWYVNPRHRHVVRKWVIDDEIFIKPVAACCSSYAYVLQNRSIEDQDKQLAEVNLIELPFDASPYIYWINQIDYQNRLVYLNDNTIWHINPRDWAFNRWRVGHRVIIGVNNKWRTHAFPHILINTNIYRYPYCESD